MFVKSYIINQSEETIADVETTAAQTNSHIIELQDVVDSTLKSQLATEIHKDLDLYITTFHKVVELDNSSKLLLDESLTPKGGEAAGKFYEVMINAKEVGNAEIVYLAGISNQKIYLTGLIVESFLRNPNQSSYESVTNQIASTNLTKDSLTAIITNQDSIVLIDAAFDLLNEY